MSTPIAVIFDFDDTLAPDSTSGFLASIGVDPQPFWRQTVQQLLDEDWDPIPAYLWRMIELSRGREEGDRITRDRLRAWGERVTFFDGVEALFQTLRDEAKATSDDVDVEFYIVSSGIGEVLRTTSIARHFRDIWACDFHYGDQGEIVYPKNIVSFTEKTKYLYKVSKGFVGAESRGKPFEVNQRVAPQAYRIPFERMIVIADGQTDIPMFALVKRYGGLTFGVFDPDRPSRWDQAFSFVRARRVDGLYSARFHGGSDLQKMLRIAVRDIARRAVGGRPAPP